MRRQSRTHRHILLQAAAERDVDELRAAADAEHGLARVCERAHQLDLIAIAHLVAGPLSLLRLLAVGARADVGAALEHQAIERRGIVGGAAAERQQENERAARADPVGDRVLQVVEELGMDAARTRLGVKQARRDADPGHALKATSTSSSIFFASPKSMRVLSL